MINHSKELKVLVCPLDWGLGHATRCIPIIKELLSNGAEVIIAGDGYSLDLLKQEFPFLESIWLKGYRISFSRFIPLSIKMVLSSPRILWRICKEHKEIDTIVTSRNIDVVIADNRYGLWNNRAYSIFITHQLNILPPSLFSFISPVLRSVVRKFILKYNECWIPDDPGSQNISGKLSHGYSIPLNTSFIGPLSRFNSADTTSTILSSIKFDIIAILSGPEPHRSEFERILKEQLSNFNKKSLIIRGITNTNTEESTINNLTLIDHLPASSIQSLLNEDPVVICRGGYSTLMDLSFTGNKVICVPTPGQTEQEYLAKKGSSENRLVYCNQKYFSLNDCLSKVKSTTGITKANTVGYHIAVAMLIAKFR